MTTTTEEKPLTLLPVRTDGNEVMVKDPDLDITLELDRAPDEELTVVQAVNGNYIVGYLVRDEDCPNPFEDQDGNGKIYTTHRNADAAEHAKFRKARGLDDNWQRDPKLKIDPLTVVLDCYQHSGTVWAVQGSARANSFPDKEWDVGSGVGVWVPDDSCVEHIKSRAKSKALPKEITVEYRRVDETKHRIVIEVVVGEAVKPLLKNITDWSAAEHGVLTIDNKGKGYKSFESAYRAAFALLGIKHNKQDLDRWTREVAVDTAEAAIEEYNSWLSGDCWCVCVETFDDYCVRLDEEFLSGYVGEKWAKEEMVMYLRAALADAKKQTAIAE